MLYELDGQRPQAAPDAWVAPGAQIMGKITLEAESSIWFGAVLRGDNETITLGRGSNIQENCVLHTDPGFPLTIGANCTIGHGAILHGCIIEDGALIGMGAVILNGARIGAGSLVGAGALVTEGKAFAPGSLIVGSPAKALRTLSEDEQARLLKSAEKYRWNAARFCAGLKPL